MRHAARTFLKITDQDPADLGSSFMAQNFLLQERRTGFWEVKYLLRSSAPVRGILATFGGKLKDLAQTRHQARLAARNLLNSLPLLAFEEVDSSLPMLEKLEKMFPHGNVKGWNRYNNIFVEPSDIRVAVGGFVISARNEMELNKMTWLWRVQFQGSEVVHLTDCDSPEEFFRLALASLMEQASLLLEAINE